MAAPRRTRGVALGATLVLVVGLVLYATLRAGAAPSDASLALHCQPPTTAQVNLSLDTGTIATITAVAQVDFAHAAAAGTVTVPGVFSSTVYNFVLADQHLYLSAPSLTSLVHSTWVSVPVSTPPWDVLSLAASNLKGDFSVLDFLGTRTTHVRGPFTTVTFRRASGSITLPADVPFHVPHPVSVTTTLTVARAGQLAAASLHVVGRSLDLSLSLTVAAYDAPVSITVPTGAHVQPLTPALRARVLGSHAGRLNQLLSPAGIASLGQIRVN